MTVHTIERPDAAHPERVSERPDPEVPQRARRRTFTAAYKLAVLAEYDNASEPGAKGAILRREGLYSAHIVEWRKARQAGALAGLSRPRGRRPADPLRTENEQLRREKARLEAELAKAQFVIEVQGKVHALLETLSESAALDPPAEPEPPTSTGSRR